VDVKTLQDRPILVSAHRTAIAFLTSGPALSTTRKSSSDSCRISTTLAITVKMSPGQ
jgi:hypothetical protein